MDREKVITEIVERIEATLAVDSEYVTIPLDLLQYAISLLKEQEAKQYNSHEVACIIADLFGDTCACNFNNIDEWLPYKCDFRETCCPNPVSVACWEQYLKHKEGR